MPKAQGLYNSKKKIMQATVFGGKHNMNGEYGSSWEVGMKNLESQLVEN